MTAILPTDAEIEAWRWLRPKTIEENLARPIAPAMTLAEYLDAALGADPYGRRNRYFIYRLPFGAYVCHDGREVLFTSDYQPLLERRPGMPMKLADRRECVTGIVQMQRFYRDTMTAVAQWRAAQVVLLGWVAEELALAPTPRP